MIVDFIIVTVILGFAAYGFREGFLSSMSAFVGLVVGLFAAIPFATYLGQKMEHPGWRIVATVGLIAFIGSVGFAVFGLFGTRLRRRMKPQLARQADRGIGAILTAAVGAFLCWMLALPLATSQVPAVASQIKESALLSGIDRIIPDGARGVYAAIAQTLRDRGLPDVLGPLDDTQAVDVAAPDPAIAANAAVLAAGESVVKVLVTAAQCDRSATGSGFVVSDGHVITNAHVIAGASELTIASRDGTVPAAVVYTDEQTDVAVLYAPQLDLPALSLSSTPLGPDDDAVIAGYPGGGDFTLEAARVASVGMVSGPNFRQDSSVSREVYALRATVVPGNSGGPMLTSDGSVAGVIFAAAADESDVGYALTLAEIDEAMSFADATEPVDSGGCYA